MLSGWKTVIFGGVLALLGFLQGVDWVSLIPGNPTLTGWIVAGIGGIVMVLRMVTSTPVGTSK